MHRIALLLAALFIATCAVAQQYPSKPIRLVLPLAAGTATDTIVRILAQSVSASMGQPILIDNKAGANGAISASEVAKAAPDGYTLLIGTSSGLSTMPAMRKDPPYDLVADFTPITDLGRYTLFLYLHPSVPAKTLQEFVTYARANPGKLAYATGNVTSMVSFWQINKAFDLDLLHVPYKSGPQAMLDLVAGRLQAIWETPTTGLAYVKEGKLHALVTSLKTRSALLPDVPTIYEAGMPQFEGVLWMGLLGPAKLPRPIVDRLNNEFHAAMKRPDVIAAMEKQAFALTPSTPEQLGTLVKEQIDAYGRLLRAAGVQPE